MVKDKQRRGCEKCMRERGGIECSLVGWGSIAERTFMVCFAECALVERRGERRVLCVKTKEARRRTGTRIRPEGFSVRSCLDLAGSCALERAQAYHDQQIKTRRYVLV